MSVLAALGTSETGLPVGEAAARLAASGPNTLGSGRSDHVIRLLLQQFANPIIVILIVATVISLLVGDVVDALTVLVIILASSLLGFWQEWAASRAVAALLARVAVTVEVLRDGHIVSIPMAEVVSGDVVLLNAGDVIPGDGRVLDGAALLVDESALTGESYPVEKAPASLPAATPLNQRSNAVFMGSHVASGSGKVVIAVTGAGTEFGSMASTLTARAEPTGFERGIASFGYLLVRATIVLVAAILAVNLFLSRPIIESLLFSLALAVGITPQLLPAIVSIGLATGARRMAREQVIVKRLDAIEDFGAMSVLCTDKTGTLTLGSVTLADALNPLGAPDDATARLAWLNAHFQTGYTNPLDEAILRERNFNPAEVTRLDEAPYDFTRKRLSVLLRDNGEQVLITKGALQSILSVCSHAASGAGAAVDLEERRAAIEATFQRLSREGYRVLGVATRELPKDTCAVVDEHAMTFAGFLVFTDPPKPEAAEAVAELASLGIAVRMITGDNRLAAAHVGASVGLDPRHVLTGSDIANLRDPALVEAVRGTAIFAEIEPVQKERIVRALRATGAVVGYLGDGINDAPALHAADVGISVDSAVDAAKQAAVIVLLDKQLAVVVDGVRLGRQTFANTLKYINITISANFGNMLSMAAASAFLPFLPLLPGQILLLNFLSDIPAMTIAGDSVDPEMVEQPRTWDVPAIRRFMMVFGSISSLFDIITFVVLRGVFAASPELFRSAWFVVSMMTELAAMLVLRTRRPAFQSHPSKPLLLTSIAIAVVTLLLPFSPLALPLGLQALPPPILAAVTVISAGYVLMTELAKRVRLSRATLDSSAAVPLEPAR
jgi:Mg2+-importing ATPase